MSPNRQTLKRLPKEPLTPADHRVLQERFLSRMRRFFAVGAIGIALVLIEAGPETARVNAAIENPRIRWTILAAAVVLAGLVFYRRVWVCYRDRKAGFKYVDRQLIIGKNERPSTGRYAIDLEDLAYHNLELRREEFERLHTGDRYPVSFAARSGFPLTRATAKL